jgi:hypothetical protein
MRPKDVLFGQALCKGSKSRTPSLIRANGGAFSVEYDSDVANPMPIYIHQYFK